MDINQLIRWLTRMKVLGAETVSIKDMSVECSKLSEVIGSKKF